MLQIAVCEDEQADRDNLTGILKPLLDKYTEEYRITYFTSGGELLQSGGSFHLIFMDIMMEGRNGIETGQELYSRNHSTKIIYTTNFGQYCMDAVNTVHAFAFLEKPVSAEALEEQLQAFLRQYQKEEVRLEFRNVSYEENGVLSEKPILLLLTDTILYFEYIKAKKKVKIVTENMVYEYPDAISGLEERMQPYGFETSCLINTSKTLNIGVTYRVNSLIIGYGHLGLDKLFYFSPIERVNRVDSLDGNFGLSVLVYLSVHGGARFDIAGLRFEARFNHDHIIRFYLVEQERFALRSMAGQNTFFGGIKISLSHSSYLTGATASKSGGIGNSDIFIIVSNWVPSASSPDIIIFTGSQRSHASSTNTQATL